MGREFDAMAAHAPHARTGYWRHIARRRARGRFATGGNPVIGGHAAHGRQQQQNITDGMGGRPSLEPVALRNGVISR